MTGSPETDSTVRIAARYNGPAGSGNGGITVGLLAAAAGLDPATVTLRRPPPLDTELVLTAGRLLDGDELVAEVAPGQVDLDLPAPVAVAQARDAEARYAGLAGHPFPTCYVCGPDHPTGMHLAPGRVRDGVAACTWTPDAERADRLHVHAALDCPGGWSSDLLGRPMVLGRTTSEVLGVPAAGETCVVTGWHLGQEGRKVQTGSVLRGADGRLLGQARATWLVVAR